jgi:hypothetical protein
MEQPTKRLKVVNKVSWFNLHHWIDDKNVRKLVYKKLTTTERLMVERAHGIKNIGNNSMLLVDYCSAHGFLSLLQHVVNNYDSWNTYKGGSSFYNMSNNAAKYGHLNILKWMNSCGYSMDSTYCAYAAVNGHLHILQWHHEQQGYWDDTMCFNAALGGHLGILQWLCAHGCPWDKDTCVGAKKKGHQHILDWIHANECPCDCNE